MEHWGSHQKTEIFSAKSRLIAGLLSVILIMSCAAPVAFAAESQLYRFKYADPEETILIGYTGILPEVLQIPASVTTIASRAFANNSTVRQVIATPRTTRIEEYAFNRCASLESISIPRVQYIDENAFTYCEKLASVTLGDELQKIGKNAFQHCESLNEIVLPESLEIIEAGAFGYCRNLEEITIPDSVTQLGPDRLLGGDRLDNGVFAGCGLRRVRIGNGLTMLTSDLFNGCRSLEDVQISSNVTLIGEYTFAKCTSLKSIFLPDSITSIRKLAFGWTGLTTLLLPEGATIHDQAFWDCESLQYVYIPSDVQLRKDDSSNAGSIFSGCRSLKRVLFGGSAYAWDQLGLYSIDDSNAQIEFDAERPDPKPPRIEVQPASHAVDAGTTTDLRVTASVYNAFTGEPEQILYQWQTQTEYGIWADISLNNWNYAGCQTNRLTILNFPAELDGSQYRCIATNAADLTKFTVSETAILTLIELDPLPSPEPSVEPPSSAVPNLGVLSTAPGETFAFASVPGVSYSLKALNGGPEIECQGDQCIVPSVTGEYEYAVLITSQDSLSSVTVGTITLIITCQSVDTPPPVSVQVPAAPTIAGYQSGRINNKPYYVKTSGFSTMYYLRSSSGRMARVSAPSVTSSNGIVYYSINNGGTVLFPHLENGEVTCFCVFQGNMEVPVLSAVSETRPQTTSDGHQIGTVNGKPYYVKISGASTMFYLRSSSGRMARVSAPYVTAENGTRYYPVNYGGVVLFPRLANGQVTSYVTGNGESVLTVL